MFANNLSALNTIINQIVNCCLAIANFATWNDFAQVSQLSGGFGSSASHLLVFGDGCSLHLFDFLLVSLDLLYTLNKFFDELFGIFETIIEQVR